MKATASAPAKPKLTPRELEIILGLRKGLPYKNVADQLDISHGTVKTHCFNIFRKLRVTNRIEAFNALAI